MEKGVVKRPVREPGRHRVWVLKSSMVDHLLSGEVGPICIGGPLDLYQLFKAVFKAHTLSLLELSFYTEQRKWWMERDGEQKEKTSILCKIVHMLACHYIQKFKSMLDLHKSCF